MWAIVFVAVLVGCAEPIEIDYSGPVADWPEYGREKGGSRYSSLDQITRDNVDRLEAVSRLAGEAPLLVLDQFEEVLNPEARQSCGGAPSARRARAALSGARDQPP